MFFFSFLFEEQLRFLKKKKQCENLVKNIFSVKTTEHLKRASSNMEQNTLLRAIVVIVL